MHLDSPCHHLLGRHIGLYSVQQPPAIAVAILHINKHGYRKRDIRGESGPGQGRFAVFMGGGRSQICAFSLAGEGDMLLHLQCLYCL